MVLALKEILESRRRNFPSSHRGHAVLQSADDGELKERHMGTVQKGTCVLNRTFRKLHFVWVGPLHEKPVQTS